MALFDIPLQSTSRFDERWYLTIKDDVLIMLRGVNTAGMFLRASVLHIRVENRCSFVAITIRETRTKDLFPIPFKRSALMITSVVKGAWSRLAMSVYGVLS